MRSLAPPALLERVIIPAMDRLGQDWERGDVSLAQLNLIIVGGAPFRLDEQLPDEVLRGVSEAVHRWGRYPLTWAHDA